MAQQAAAVFNHVALAVPNLEEAVSWYKKHFHLKTTCGSATFDAASDPENFIFKLYGPPLRKLKVAWLSTGNGVGLELFEFIEPSSQNQEAFDFEKQYTRGGFFHICLTVPDPVITADECAKDGGASIGERLDYRGEDGEGPVSLYIRDPWGNIIELMSISFERMMANRSV